MGRSYCHGAVQRAGELSHCLDDCNCFFVELLRKIARRMVFEAAALPAEDNLLVFEGRVGSRCELATGTC